RRNRQWRQQFQLERSACYPRRCDAGENYVSDFRRRGVDRGMAVCVRLSRNLVGRDDDRMWIGINQSVADPGSIPAVVDFSQGRLENHVSALHRVSRSIDHAYNDGLEGLADDSDLRASCYRLQAHCAWRDRNCGHGLARWLRGVRIEWSDEAPSGR